MLTLCQKWPNLEWSGFCLHTKSDDLFQETIIVHAIYLMDVGTATATDFYGNSDMAELLVDNPDLSELVFKNGYRFIQCKVHSHNNMPSFFSQGAGASDQQDLEDNSKGQDMYLSIVVNNKMEFFARACRWVKTEETVKTVQVLHNGKYQNYSYKVPARSEKIVQDCSVQLGMQNPDWFTKRLGEIKPTRVVQSFTGKWGNDSWDSGWKPTSKTQPQIEFDYGDVEEYSFEDELKFVFSLPKKCDAKSYLRNNKVDLQVMEDNLSTYDKAGEDSFYDNLTEWVITNNLVESPFFNQISTYLKHVEA